MKIEISIPPVILIESWPPRYTLGFSLESTELKAVITKINNESMHIKLFSPCPHTISSQYEVLIEKSYVEPKINFSSYCVAEKALLKILSQTKKVEQLLSLDDFADLLSLEEQKVIKSAMLGGIALFFNSLKYESVIPLIYLPPPPRLQIILSRRKLGQTDSHIRRVTAQVSTLISILGLISSVWKEDVTVIDELLSLISTDLYGDNDYLENPPLIPLPEENLYLSILPRTSIGCPTKLIRYREKLFNKIEKEEMMYTVMNISHGVKINIID